MNLQKKKKKSKELPNQLGVGIAEEVSRSSDKITEANQKVIEEGTLEGIAEGFLIS